MLTQRQLEIVSAQLLNDKKYQAMKARYDTLKAKGKLLQAANEKARLNKYYLDACQAFEFQSQKKYISLREAYSGLPESQENRLRNNVIAMSFIIDAIDTFVSTINEILDKSAYSTALFDDLSKLGKEAKSLMGHFTQESAQHDQMWADYMDSIEDYLLMRATAYNKKDKALTRKIEKEKAKENGKEKDTPSKG